MAESLNSIVKLGQSLRPIGRLLAAAGLFGLASGGLFSIIGVRLAETGIAEFWIGALSSAYFVGTLMGSATAGILVRRAGHGRAFTAFALLAAASTVGLALTDELAGWFALRMLTGYAMGAYYLIIESWINHRANNANRGQSMAFYECSRMSAIALSPVLLGAGDGMAGFALAAGLFLLAVLPVGHGGAAEPGLSRSARLPLRHLLALAPLGPTACFVAGLLSSAFYGLGAVYATRLGLARESVMLFMSVTWFAPLLVQIPAGAMADRLGREWLLVTISTGTAAAALAIALVGAWSLPLLLLLTFLVGGLSHPLYALGVGLLNDRLPREEVVRAGATLLVGYGLGTSLGPALGAIAMALLGASGLYVFFAAALLLLAALVGGSFLRRGQRRGAPGPRTGRGRHSERQHRRTQPRGSTGTRPAG